MIPVFYQYEREKNILDSLIEEFAKRNWLFDEMPTDYFHKYKWPDIVLTDKEAVILMPNGDRNIEQEDFSYAIELLGCYEPNSDAKKGGSVILYIPKIRATALQFLKENGISPDELHFYTELLCSLVLIHEFAHWIVQMGVFKINETDKSAPLKFEYDNKESIFFHETIAQIFTNYFCLKGSVQKDMFLWLEEKQPIQYQIYKKLLYGTGVEQLHKNGELYSPEDRLFHKEVELKEIEKIIFALMVLRVNDKQPQSYTDLLFIYQQIKSDGTDVNRYFNYKCIEIFKNWDWKTEGFENFLEKNRGGISGKKYNI